MEKIYNIVSSGSTGNCEIYAKRIMVDCGVPFKSIEPYLKDIQIIVLSHVHGDHFNISTIKRIQFERPSVRIACGSWMVEHLKGLRNIDVLDLNVWYNYGAFKLSIGHLYHDVPNAFIRLNIDGFKIFRATDTDHLQGISAKGYNLFSIEANYNPERHLEAIEYKRSHGIYSYEEGAMNSHLSSDQAWNFFNENRKPSSELVKLHISSSY